jgi:uncharacterized RDD family membrane protein YckC
MEVIDQPAIEATATDKYAGFWYRLGALIIDGLVLAPVTFGISYFNITAWKSVEILILLSLIGIIYKPWMEFKFGATVGKMALKMKVVNFDGGQPTLQEILLRNIFHLAGSVFSLVFTIGVYMDPQFEYIDGYMQYSAFANGFMALKVTGWIMGVIVIVDGIVMIADKESKSLHDRIGNTYVIVNE